MFWDTNLFVYLFERTPLLADRVIEIASRMRARGDRLFTSALAVGETLVRPARLGRNDVVDNYLRLFRSNQVTVLPFNLEAAQHYASIRLDRGIRPPDAIHLACAAAASIDLFLTNDEALSRKIIPEIRFISNLERSPL
ncbi:MAG: type II toxin-antitoxin system VapC family toxin [Acidobacteriota bacterium]|nr:type II toxin-antitoxin system VapC family toxin [Acidobacteriota bacterium]